MGLKASQAITDCQQPRTIGDPAEKQYFTLYFPKEKEEAEKKAKKFALNYVKSNFILVPNKNFLPFDPIRKIMIPFFNPLSTKNLNGRSTQSIIFFFQCGTFTQKQFMNSKLVSILKMMYVNPPNDENQRMLANYLLNLSRVFLCDTLYYAIMSMKMMLTTSGERMLICLAIISMFRRILSSIIWTQNSTGSECLLLSHLQEKYDFPFSISMHIHPPHFAV